VSSSNTFRNNPSISADSKKWVIVQLSTSAEKEKNLSAFSKSVKRHLGKELAVFVPAATLSAREDNHVVYYMEGYIFVEYFKGINYNRLNDTAYFSNVLTHPSTGVHLIDDSEISHLRKGMAEMKIGAFSKGDEVKVTKGSFKNMTGKVSFVYDGGESVQIDVGLKSKPYLIDYPANYLVKL